MKEYLKRVFLRDSDGELISFSISRDKDQQTKSFHYYVICVMDAEFGIDDGKVWTTSNYQNAEQILNEQIYSYINQDNLKVHDIWIKDFKSQPRPEIIDLLYKKFPIGCTVEIVDSIHKNCIGVKGKVFDIDNYGRLSIKHHYKWYSWNNNVLRKVSD